MLNIPVFPGPVAETLPMSIHMNKKAKPNGSGYVIAVSASVEYGTGGGR